MKTKQIVLMILSLNLGVVFSEENVEIDIINFPVTINGEEIDNMHSDYPLISYKSITYFPMTWDYSRSLGLETTWTVEYGLFIKSIETRAKMKQSLNSNNMNVKSKIANLPNFDIYINGINLDNSKETYPILTYRSITYFPLTWKFAVETFGWNYN